MSCSKRPLEDAADRCQKYRKVGLARMPLESLGFHETNRGRAGCLPYHVHEVAAACNGRSTKVVVSLYNEVSVIKVPQAALEAWRAANLSKCMVDPLMPAFSSTMTHAFLDKTLFVNAQKLNKERIRTLFNEGHAHCL